jgi:hypothetical protein
MLRRFVLQDMTVRVQCSAGDDPKKLTRRCQRSTSNPSQWAFSHPIKTALVVLLAERCEQTRTHRAVFPIAPCPNMSCWSRYSCSRTAELEGEREGGVRKVLTGRKVRPMHELWCSLTSCRTVRGACSWKVVMPITESKLCGGAGYAASCSAPHHRDVVVKMLLTIVALLPCRGGSAILRIERHVRRVLRESREPRTPMST